MKQQMTHTSRVPARPGCDLRWPAARHRWAVPAGSSGPTTWTSRAPGTQNTRSCAPSRPASRPGSACL